MGVFGFIENFFFISLALVFILVLLLVYHFKNRITVAEKKSENMYGLLTAVVKEIKLLRGMFGMGNEQTSPTIPASLDIEVKSKTDPEVSVECREEPSQIINTQKTEVITLDLSESEDKIVVSDDDDDADSDEYLSDDSDSECENNNDCDDDDDDYDERPLLMKVDYLDISISELKKMPIVENKQLYEEITFDDKSSTDCPFSHETPSGRFSGESSNSYAHASLRNCPEDPQSSSFAKNTGLVEDGIRGLSAQEVDTPLEFSSQNNKELEPELILELEPESENSKEMFDQPTVPIPTIDQLRKMNINQLKTVASQIGISTDITKLKKPELISLIQTSVN